MPQGAHQILFDMQAVAPLKDCTIQGCLPLTFVCPDSIDHEMVTTPEVGEGVKQRSVRVCDWLETQS